VPVGRVSIWFGLSRLTFTARRLHRQGDSNPPGVKAEGQGFKRAIEDAGGRTQPPAITEMPGDSAFWHL
jgi:hypothetical protein